MVLAKVKADSRPSVARGAKISLEFELEGGGHLQVLVSQTTAGHLITGIAREIYEKAREVVPGIQPWPRER